MSRTTLCRRLAVALASCMLAEAACAHPVPSADRQAAIPIAIHPDWRHPRTRFVGWGTSLAWFANVTGKWPDPVRNRLADLLFGRDGLGLTIARYNIGGGRRPGTPPLSRYNANMDGFWKMPVAASGKDWWRPDDPAMWNWDADPGQQWWLDAVRDRVPERVRLFEACAYSPPWFMTVNGAVSGAEKPYQPNLRPGFEAPFATYLADVMRHLEQRHHIVFHSLDPLNEPNTPYWIESGHQEGDYVSPAGQARLILAAARAMRADHLSAVVSAMDETNPYTFVVDWSGYSDAARAAIGQLNVHAYSTTGESGPRDIARQTGLPLWMSEVDLSAPNTHQDFTNRPSALALGAQIVTDLKTLEPAAWVLWQAVEPSAEQGDPGSNWGLIRADMSSDDPADKTLHVTDKYWAMANFSRYIRPGFQLIANDDPDTVTAMSPDGGRLVVVHVNHGPFVRHLTVDLPDHRTGSWTVETIVSDASRDARRIGSPRTGGDPVLIAPPLSVSTFILHRLG